MEGRIFKFLFRGPVHFGSGRLSDSQYACSAATLFSALFMEALAAGGSDELLRAVNQGECVLSDCFPYVGGRLYLPKPMISFQQEETKPSDSEDSLSRKAAKKLKYVPSDCLGDYLDGGFNFLDELEKFELGASFLRTKVNLTRSASDDAEPYFVGGYSYYPNCGIYFINQGKYDIEPLVERLSLSGLGGKRTSGYGAFDYVVADFPKGEIPGIPSGKKYMLLASASPRKEELVDSLLDGACFKLERCGGFVQSATHAETPRKKRDMWLFRPGSIFSERFAGDVFDVNNTPGSHPVYRYAKAMWMEV